MADGVGHDPPGQVDLDAELIAVMRLNVRITLVSLVKSTERISIGRIVGREVVEPLRAHHERGHDLAAVALLP
jgi:hypothetical protein